MANLGRGDNVDETSLATATAAIITARWGGPSRRAQTPGPDRRGHDFGSAAHNGAAPVMSHATANGHGAMNGSYGSSGFAPTSGAGARATATVDRPTPAEPSARAPESYRGSQPPMFTPSTVAPAPAPEPFEAAGGEAYAPPGYAAPGYAAPAYAPDPHAPTFSAFVPPDLPVPPDPYPPADQFAPVEPHPYPSGEHPLAEPGLFTPTVPVPRSPAAPDALEAPEFNAFAPVDDFADSVMSGLAFPEPFVPEPYDPMAFQLPGYGSDGAAANGHADGDGPGNGSANGHGPTNGHGAQGYAGVNGNGHSSNGNGHANGYGGAGSSREPVSELLPERREEPGRRDDPGRRDEAGRARVPAARVSSFDPLDINTEPMLPRRVPSKPDVPDVFLPNDPADDGFELTRIASYLREEKVDETDNRPDGFDVAYVLSAVRGVPGVSDAQLRWNTGYGHTLRVEFEPGADEGEVTRAVAGMLRESMGLAAQPGTLVPGIPAPRWNGEENTLERSRRSAAPASASGGRAIPGPGLPLPNPGGPGPGLASGPGLAPSGGMPLNRLGPAGSGLPNPRPASGAAPVRGPRDDAEARPAPAPARGNPTGTVRVILDHVQVTTLGVDAKVEVRLAVSGGSTPGAVAHGTGQGPAVDAYLLRLAASAAGDAIDQLLIDPAAGNPRGRTFIEHVSVVPFGSIEVAVVVALLMSGPGAEQVSGSAIVTGDPREAVVRATLSAVNRRLESLLA